MATGGHTYRSEAQLDSLRQVLVSWANRRPVQPRDWAAVRRPLCAAPMLLAAPALFMRLPGHQLVSTDALPTAGKAALRLWLHSQRSRGAPRLPKLPAEDFTSSRAELLWQQPCRVQSSRARPGRPFAVALTAAAWTASRGSPTGFTATSPCRWTGSNFDNSCIASLQSKPSWL